MAWTARNGAHGLWRNRRRALAIGFDNSPIPTLDTPAEFNRIRAAHVARTALYGYLKTRTGIRYPAIFQDDRFTVSINLSKSRMFAACLADPTGFATAPVARDSDISSDENAAFARVCYGEALGRTASESTLRIDPAEATARFAECCSAVNRGPAAIGEAAFTQSPEASIESALIDDELKQYDTEIVGNLIRFRWRDVRDQLKRRLDADAPGIARTGEAETPPTCA